jgi:hypothetical protein
MGEASTIAALPAYQLALPFTHEAQRVMDYIPLVRRMTLCDFASGRRVRDGETQQHIIVSEDRKGAIRAGILGRNTGAAKSLCPL